MESRQAERNYEENRLKQTISFAEEQLAQAKKTALEKEEEIMDAKKDIRENTAHSITNLWSSEDFEALAELSQYINPVTDKIAAYEEEKHKILLLENMIRSPYFARIDFKFDGEETFEKIYIGRSSLKKNKYQEMYVYDWRSPIASVFYRFMTGKAYYDAPCGRITGEVGLKRQYEIKNGTLEYFFDADVQIFDEFLRQLLSQNTTAKMKAIVETIQQEQDVVIRDMENDLLMVQGVAGSGKTSIALHRAAYLMYQGLQGKLSANNIMIISPNSVFEQYISNVLPELGEDNVVSAVFDDILRAILNDRKMQSGNEHLERLIAYSKYSTVIKSSIEFKTSDFFSEILDRFLADLPYQWIKSVQPDVVELYNILFHNKSYFYSLTQDNEPSESLEEIWEYTRENLETDRLYYDDAIAISYLYLKIYGTNTYKNIKQVVIDEAQDYYPLQYKIYSLLFPNAKFTILGDINQTLTRKENISLYEQIPKMLHKKKSSLILLDKSFRCTNEILNFSLQFIKQNPKITSFNRKGDHPEVFIADTPETFIDKMIKEINVCRKKGFRSIGLICKTEENANDLFQEIKLKTDIQLIKDGSMSDLQGTFIIPVYMSKGLEFDAVIVCDADSQNYHTKDDQNLLYVACTRALHRLSLFCEKELSPLVQAT